MRGAVLRPTRRHDPRRKIGSDLVPSHRGHFLAPLAGQHEHPDDGVERAGAIGRFPDRGKLGVGQHAVALGDGRQRKVGERIYFERAALDRPLVAGASVGGRPARHGHFAILGEGVEHADDGGAVKSAAGREGACSKATRTARTASAA